MSDAAWGVVLDSGAAIVFAVSVSGAAFFGMTLVDRRRDRRARVVVRGRSYRVTGYTAEGEPRLTRIDP